MDNTTGFFLQEVCNGGKTMLSHLAMHDCPVKLYTSCLWDSHLGGALICYMLILGSSIQKRGRNTYTQRKIGIQDLKRKTEVALQPLKSLNMLSKIKFHFIYLYTYNKFKLIGFFQLGLKCVYLKTHVLKTNSKFKMRKIFPL